MRVAILAYTFPRGMGYIGNMLPRYLARLGAEVHYITMDLPHDFQSADRNNSYGTFSGLDVMDPGAVESYGGFTLHGLGHRVSLGQMKYLGLEEKLRSLRIDVVQSLVAIGWPAQSQGHDQRVQSGARLPQRVRYSSWGTARSQLVPHGYLGTRTNDGRGGA